MPKSTQSIHFGARCPSNPAIARLQHELPDYNIRVILRYAILGLCFTLLCGCAPPATTGPVAPTALFITATLPASPNPSATLMPGTPTPPPSASPLIGTTTTQINVRPEPRSSSSPIGLLGPATSIPVLGTDPGSNWYQILYEAGPAGMGWVASEYVKVPDGSVIPMVGGGDSNSMASVREQINVRSGPGTNFDSLGILSPRDVVTLAGKDRSGAWLQVEFAAGPEKRGWVAASFLEVINTDQLPIVDDRGEVVGTSTPTGGPPTPSPTLAAAKDDQDSAEAPAVDVKFAPSGVGAVLYASDLSSPEGDATDWIRFTTYGPEVSIAVACSGNGTLSAELVAQGESSPESLGSACGEAKRLTLTAGKTYMLRISIIPAAAQLAYGRYQVRIDGSSGR